MKLINRRQLQGIRRRFVRLYGDRAENLVERLYMMIGRYGVGDEPSPRIGRWTESDVVLITYADTVQKSGEMPLETLKRFCDKRLRGVIKNIHFLPFSPWSSDDGFSVIDYREVEPAYGNWLNIESFAEDFGLMFDLVLNHCSSRSSWFRDYINGIEPGRHYFIEADPETDLSAVTRPRPWPLLTPIQTRDGLRHVWTTFSSDQVDLNWKNPDVFFEFLDILFLYISKGVRILRLDAVAFLWKEIGTSCLHLPNTHEIIKLLRDILEIVAPEVILLTETNVPHEENISYFGEGDEAHMVYQFSLPPLLLHALLRNDTSHLHSWLKDLPEPPEGCTYLNFTASHDGIGVRPLQGILESEELEWIIEQVKFRGGRVSMKRNPDGSESPYELNITYLDALGDPSESLHRARFLCSQAVALALQGVPAVYFHSLVGTRNYQEGVEETGQNRTINRRKWDLDELKSFLEDSKCMQSYIYYKYLQMVRRRNNHQAFHPYSSQEVLDLGKTLLGFVRSSLDQSDVVLCLFNFSAKATKLTVGEVYPPFKNAEACKDLISGKIIKKGPNKEIKLNPYQAMWLTARF